MEHFDWIKGAVLPYINFFIFAALAYTFFRKPLVGMAAKRRADYDKMFEEAKLARDQAEAQKNELDKRYAQLESEIQQIKENAQRAAEAEGARLVQNAKELEKHIKNEAERISQTELDQARRTLKQSIVDEVQAAVQARLKSDLDGSKQSELVQLKIKDLKSVCAEQRV